MTQQGDELMKRKMANLVQRQQSVSTMHPSRSFCFTEQLTASPARGDAEGAGRASAVPDNWVAPSTGTYFTSRDDKGAASGKPVQHTKTHEGLLPHMKQQRVSPAERQAHIDRVIQDRVLNALVEQRASEVARLDACKAQRELEIVKFHQRMKHRTELQIKSAQVVLGHSVDQMGLDNLMHATNCLTLSQTAVERNEHRGDAQRHHIEYNQDRIERSLLHRQYCLESHKERERFRQGLEAHVGTLYSRTKTQLLNDIGVVGPEATFVSKTIHELRADGAKHKAAKEEAQQASQEVLQLANEVTAMDDRLWEERRKTKGQKSVRSREVVYAIDAPFRRAQSSEPIS